MDTKEHDALLRDLKGANIVVVGRSGVGKSTLINTVLHRNYAAMGQGEPVTMGLQKFWRRDIPSVAIWDTKGLELGDWREAGGAVVDKIVELANGRRDRWMNVAWLCIDEDTRRVEDAEKTLLTHLARYVAVLIVITKARSDLGFCETVRQLLPKARDVVRVRSLSDVFDDGQKLHAMDMAELLLATKKILSYGITLAKRLACGYTTRRPHASLNSSEKLS